MESKLQYTKNLLEKFQEQNDTNENVLKSKITYEYDNKLYILKMFILQDIKKLKLTLEVNDKTKIKSNYTNTFSLNDLINQNKFFNKFKDYSEAFNYLLNNYTKVEKTMNINKNQIKIFLLFTIDDVKNKNITQQSIEFNLNYIQNNLNRNKSNTYLNTTINNLKTTLEKFNNSIFDLKLNIDNEKNENKNIKNELTNLIETKLKEIKNDKIFTEIKNKIKNLEDKHTQENKDKDKDKNNFTNKLDEIYDKLDNFNKQINELKIKIDENEKKYKTQPSQNTKNTNNENISQVDMEKINAFMKKISNLEENIKLNNEKNQKLENNLNNKLSELNNKINSGLKKETEISDKQELSLKKEGDGMLEKLIEEKIDQEINDKMKIYEEKILILNKKIIDLEIKNQNKLFKDAMLKNDQSSFINDSSYIDFKIQELGEKVNKSKEINTNEKPKLNDKEKENKINQIVENKMENLKKNLYSMMNDMKEDLMKSLENKTNTNDNKNEIQEIQEINKSNETKLKNRLKRKKNYDTNTSININNSDIMTTTPRINSLNSYEDEDIKSPKNVNTSFNNFSLNISKIKKIFELNIDTNILNKEELSEDFFLFSKLKKIYHYNRFIRLKLIYRGSRDGDGAKNFHTKCDLIGPNLTLIKTKKGFVFGGFTIKSWKHLYKDIKKDNPEYGTEYADKECFCFSVNLQKIYENEKKNENVIFCNNKYGMIFCGFLKVFDEYLKNGGICGKKDENCFGGQEKDYEFNGGEEKFEIEDIEVFQIAFR